MSGRVQPEAVNPATFPEVLYGLWEVFKALHAARCGYMGPSPILESEIRAYCLNRLTRLSEWEIGAIRMLDGVALST